MAFFLLGHVDDTLTLLSPDTFATRQDALAALSRITAKPDFSQWDVDVLMLDTDTGTPVLLLRPASAAPVEAETIDDEPVSSMDDAPLGAPEAAEEEPLETVIVEEPLPVAEEEAPVVADAEDAPVVEPEAVLDAAIADAILEEYEEAAEPTESDLAESLKDALTRTTAQMEAEGVVVPDSIGAPEADLEPVTDSAWPWDVAIVAPEHPLLAEDSAFVLSELEEPSLDDASILHTTIDDEMFAAAQPVILGAYASVPAMPEIVEASDSPVLEIPVEPMGAFASEAMGAPVSADFAVPVIADPDDIFPVEPEPIEPAEESVDETTPEAGLEPASEADSDPELGESEPDSEAAEVPESLDTSDYIFDLENAPPVVAAPTATDRSSLDEYTCEDCVYDETCPNKDQRLPKDCGSFQWR